MHVSQSMATSKMHATCCLDTARCSAGWCFWTCTSDLGVSGERTLGPSFTCRLWIHREKMTPGPAQRLVQHKAAKCLGRKYCCVPEARNVGICATKISTAMLSTHVADGKSSCMPSLFCLSGWGNSGSLSRRTSQHIGRTGDVPHGCYTWHAISGISSVVGVFYLHLGRGMACWERGAGKGGMRHKQARLKGLYEHSTTGQAWGGKEPFWGALHGP